MFLYSQLLKTKEDSVAQLVEHYTFNVVVLGSNPSGITRFNIKTTQNPANQMIAGFLFLGKTLKYAPILI